MSDRELLRLAAIACGELHGEWVDNGAYFDGVLTRWNPLADAGDRHRLLVDLKMTLAHEPSRGGWSVGAIVQGEFRWLAHDDDEARAIVRAAAELAKEAA